MPVGSVPSRPGRRGNHVVQLDVLHWSCYPRPVRWPGASLGIPSLYTREISDVKDLINFLRQIASQAEARRQGLDGPVPFARIRSQQETTVVRTYTIPTP